MSEELASLSQEAGELLRYAMDPHETPYQNKRYSVLLNQLYTSPNFKLIFENVAHGLEIQVLAYSPHGVFLAGRERSPFAFRMEDYRGSMKPEERVVHGVFMLGIAAYCFPTIDVFPSPPSHSLARTPSASTLQHFNTSTCREAVVSKGVKSSC